MNEKRSQSLNEKRAINWWKWVLLSLISIIVMGLLFFIKALQPVIIQETMTAKPSELQKDKISLVSTITTEDAEIIINRSIDSMIIDENISYEVILDDQLEIHSNIELFNMKIPYTLFFDPFVTEDGNLQLRADVIELANFSLPVSAVLTLLAGELELPFYIKVDSSAKIILIDFNELSTQHDIGATMNKIDLGNNEIQLKLSVNHATLIKALNFDKE